MDESIDRARKQQLWKCFKNQSLLEFCHLPTTTTPCICFLLKSYAIEQQKTGVAIDIDHRVTKQQYTPLKKKKKKKKKGPLYFCFKTYSCKKKGDIAAIASKWICTKQQLSDISFVLFYRVHSNHISILLLGMICDQSYKKVIYDCGVLLTGNLLRVRLWSRKLRL